MCSRLLLSINRYYFRVVFWNTVVIRIAVHCPLKYCVRQSTLADGQCSCAYLFNNLNKQCACQALTVPMTSATLPCFWLESGSVNGLHHRQQQEGYCFLTLGNNTPPAVAWCLALCSLRWGPDTMQQQEGYCLLTSLKLKGEHQQGALTV